MIRKSLYLALLLFGILVGTQAQETSLNTGADIMSRYIWRGLQPGGSSPGIQPSLEFTANNFTAGTWGAFSVSNNLTVQETDLYLSYAIKEMFSVTVTDYFLPDESLARNNYFEWKEDNTGHLLEASASFTGTDSIPFTFLVAVNFWGADARNINNKKQYSTYFELGYQGTCKEVEYNIFIGGTPTNPDSEAGETGYYGTEAGITNIGIAAIKYITITDKFTLPVSTSFIINPQSENVYLVFGITL